MTRRSPGGEAAQPRRATTRRRTPAKALVSDAAPPPAPAAPPPSDAPVVEARDDGYGWSPAAVGLGLMVIGLVLLAAQVLRIDFGRAGWPSWIIVPGAAMAAIGLSRRDGMGLTIAGFIVGTVGLILLYQDTTGRWESWAYIWALFPVASGVATALHGARSGDGALVRNGTWGALGGLALLVVLYIFFEGIIGIGGQPLGLPSWLLPTLLLGIGVVMVLRAVLSREPAEA